jgi:hypothetical protein
MHAARASAWVGFFRFFVIACVSPLAFFSPFSGRWPSAVAIAFSQKIELRCTTAHTPRRVRPSHPTPNVSTTKA